MHFGFSHNTSTVRRKQRGCLQEEEEEEEGERSRVI